MATAAQIEANRRNSQKSTGPRTGEGKNRSRFNAVDHGCRASILVLPANEFAEYENQSRAWKLSFKPRNPAEEFLIDRIVSLGCLTRRIDQAQTARLTRRMHFGFFDEEAEVEGEVIELGQKLFRDACGPVALHLERGTSELCSDGEVFRISDYDDDEDQPMRLVHRLQTSGPGCQWMLEQWTELRARLEGGTPWLAPDKLKAVRLLGRHPIDAIDCEDVARVYLASFVLLDQEGDPFQEILNDLSADEAVTYAGYLKHRHYDRLAPKDAEAAREMLLEIINRSTLVLEDKADVYRELEQINLQTAGHRLSWDDTPEGERLRRYEMGTQRMWSRLFDMLLKIRSSGSELDIATIASICRSVPTVTMDEIDEPATFIADDITPSEEAVIEPQPPIEANSAGENAPNEANSRVQEISLGRQGERRDFRIDAPHTERRRGGIGRAARTASHPALERALGGRQSTLLNLSPIFGVNGVGG
jgi:hypothetical protein